MHGIVHAELRDFAIGRVGADGWDEALARAGVPGKVHLLSETYPDEELAALLEALVDATGEQPGPLLEQFGAASVPGLLKTYGSFLKAGWRTLDVVEHTERVIHRTVRLQHPGADPPPLRAERTADDEVRILYDSPRRLCAFGTGVIQGIADHYGESVEIAQPSCMLRGDTLCEIAVTAA
jgi:predicted hydrocarbon binding protein